MILDAPNDAPTTRQPGTVLIVDDDPTACAILGKTLEKGGFSIEILHDGAAALRRMKAPNAPRILLLDWVMPDLSGLDVCRSLRAGEDGLRPYVFLVSSRQSEADALQGFDAGVDEFIAKPFDPPLLLARVQSAQRRLDIEDPRGVRGFQALLRQASAGLTGEVIVRGKTRTGRVIFHQGKVAWVHVSGGTPLLPLLERLGLNEQDSRQLLQECQSRHLPFLDTLAEWGIVPQETLRGYFREELSARLAHLTRVESLTSFFVPERASLQSHLSYELRELLPPASEPPFSVLVPEPSSPRVPSEEAQGIMDRLLEIEGVQCAGLVDQESGWLSCSGKEACNERLLRRMVRLFRAEEEMAFEESMMVNATSYHLLRSLPDRWLVYVSVDRRANPNLALLRLKMTP
ncbi:MAG: response regulator transcription factor [Polyangiaceae bacterium]|jgi:CheY-like chemotaxis protein|nr:response regulator transcription factor [Polyangiaceae bacterium]